MITRFPAFALLLVLAGAVAPLPAQTTIAYPNGSTDSTSRSTTGNPLTLQVNATDSATQSGALSGSGSVTKTGTGTLTLSGGNSYTGGTLVDAGTLVAAYNNNESGTFAAGSTVTVNAGATLVANGNDALGWGSGNAKLVVNGGTLTTDAVTGQHTSLQDVTMTGGRITSPASDGHFLLNGPLVTLASATTASIDAPYLELAPGWASGVVTSFNVARGTTSSGIDLSIASLIYGSGLVKTGGGTLALSHANTYSGDTTISSGTLALAGGDGRLPAGTTVYLYNGATLDLGGNSVTVAGLGSASQGIVGNITAGTLTTSGEIFLQSGTFATTFEGNSPNARLWIGGNSNATVTLTGANNRIYDGGDQVIIGHETTGAAGTVRLGHADALAAADQKVHVFSGTLDLNGQTLVRAGEIRLHDEALLINDHTTEAASFNQAIVLGSDATDVKRIGGRGELTLGGVISGGGGLSKIGTGILVLNETNTYTGKTIMSEGTLSVASLSNAGVAGSLGQPSGDAAMLVFAGGTLHITGATATDRNFFTYPGQTAFIQNDADVTFSGDAATSSGGLTKTGIGTLTLSGNNRYKGATTISDGVLSVATIGDGPVAGNLGLALTSAANLVLNGGTLQYTGGTASTDRNFALAASSRIEITAAGTNLTFAGSSAATAAGLEKLGDGTLTFSGDNLYTGVTTIYAGTLQIGAGSTSGSIAGDIINNSGLVFNRSDDVTHGGAITSPGTFIKAGAGTLTLSGRQEFQGLISISEGTLVTGEGADITSSHIFNDGTLILNYSSQVSYAGIIDGAGSLTKAGAGTLTLWGSSSYGGATTISGGTLALAGGANQLSSATTVYLDNDAALDLGGNSLTVAGLGSASHRIVGNITAGTLTTSGEIFLQSGTFATTFEGSSPTARLWIGGNSDATVTLAGANHRIYDGGDQVIIGHDTTGAAGTVRLGHADALAAADQKVHVFSGTLDLNGQTLVRAGEIHLQAGGQSSLINGDVTEAASFNHALVLHGLDNDVNNIGGAGVLALGGVISGNGGLSKTGTGILVLNEANTYTGKTIMSEGTLSVASLSNAGAAGSFGQPSGDAATLSFAGGKLHITGATATDRNFIIYPGKTAFIQNDANVIFSGDAANSNGGLTKTGAGALTLSGVNRYRGATTVADGSLMVNGSLANTAVTVASGATLGGSGTIGGFTTLQSGAHLAPGNSPGTLTFTNGLTLAAGSILDFQLGSTSDLVRITGGTLTGPASGTVTLNFSDAGGFATGTYTLFDFSTGGTATSSFDLSDFTFGSAIAGFDFTLGFAGSTLQLTASASAVPEPSTYAAFAGTAVLGLAAWRRRRPRALVTP